MQLATLGFWGIGLETGPQTICTGRARGPMATLILWCFCAAQGELHRPKRCARGLSPWHAMRPSSMTLARCHRRPAPSMLDALAQKGQQQNATARAASHESASIAAQPKLPGRSLHLHQPFSRASTMCACPMLAVEGEFRRLMICAGPWPAGPQ